MRELIDIVEGLDDVNQFNQDVIASRKVGTQLPTILSHTNVSNIDNLRSYVLKLIGFEKQLFSLVNYYSSMTNNEGYDAPGTSELVALHEQFKTELGSMYKIIGKQEVSESYKEGYGVIIEKLREFHAAFVIISKQIDTIVNSNQFADIKNNISSLAKIIKQYPDAIATFGKRATVIKMSKID